MKTQTKKSRGWYLQKANDCYFLANCSTDEEEREELEIMAHIYLKHALFCTYEYVNFVEL